MTVLVTGGAGYIGSHVANFLSLKGHQVVAFDNLSTGHQDSLLSKVRLVVGDILNFEHLSQVFSKNDFDFVFHFAAKLSPEQSLRQPLLYYENNVIGTTHLLKACQDHAVKNMIFASSSNVYGDGNKNVLTEHSALQPINPYGHSKLMCEKIIADFSSVSDFRYQILRFFNVAGAHHRLTNGQKGLHPYHIIHRASKAALGFFPDVQVFGQDYPTDDGTCVRDFIHIDDLVNLHYLCFEDLRLHRKNEVLNCGYGTGYSVKQIVETMHRLAPQKFNIKSAPRRPGDASFLVSSTEKLRRKFPAWKPEKDNLQLICQSALDWEIKLRMN